MANPDHLEKLCEGPVAWNEWREANPNLVPDLSEIKLTLHQRQFGPSNGGPIDLRLADLEHANLPYATLSGADLEGARLVGADLTHARLDGARLTGADLTDAVLDQADLTGAVLDHAVLFGAQLSNTRNLTSGQLTHAYGDASTRLPGNLLPPESWFPSDDYGDDEDDYAGWGSAAAYPEEPEQNLYEVLGLPQTATAEQIRSSYRTLVKKLHPDLNPNDQEAQDRFKKVTTAYRILNDAAQRQRYDRGEIDGEGRPDPEFEAKRRFRRAALRYYTLAASSFCVAVGALVGVWYVVLSDRESDDTRDVAVVTQPKSAERLGADKSPANRPFFVQPSAEEEAPPAETEAEVEPEPAPEAPPEPQTAEAPPPETLSPEPIQTPAADVAESQPVSEAPAEPGDGGKLAGIQIETSVTPPDIGTVPHELIPAHVRPPEPPAREPGAVPALSDPELMGLRSSQMENDTRPLFFPNQDRAGQTAASAPDTWSVGSIRQGAPKRRPAFTVEARPASFMAAVPLPPHAPFARDPVSHMLRSRAMGKSLGKPHRPIPASDNAFFSIRQTEFTSTIPTSASVRGAPVPSSSIPAASVPGQTKPRSAPASKPRSAPTAVPAAQQQPRKQQQQQQQSAPQSPRMAPRSQATASNIMEFEER